MTQPVHLTRGTPEDELVATVAILQADIVGQVRLSGLLDYVGSAVDLLPEWAGGSNIEGRSSFFDTLAVEHLELAAGMVRDWQAKGLDVRAVVDSSYPSNLQAIFNKPPLLFVQGNWDDAVDCRAIAVVGTRTPTIDGRKRAFRLAKRLAQAGVTVVSGLARGIDTAAHLGALRGKGRTVAVMGTGISRRYPAENRSLADAILARGGALLSQFFPSQPPTKWTFPVRNMTMSGLSIATVVIEAGATSGARMQAEAALTHGRQVFLPTSLVQGFSWARALVEDGHSGVRAVEVKSPDEVVERLDLSPDTETLVA